jgi:xylulose-5-phosphate/fructose-6-phosphate phosphoketolase
MTLQHPSQHPHGVSDEQFLNIFSADQPVIFAFHGYPQLIHKLIYRRPNHSNFHVHGYREEGRTTTPFDMTVINELDRFHLAAAAISRTPGFEKQAEGFRQRVTEKLTEYRRYIRTEGDDPPEIKNWRWDV